MEMIRARLIFERNIVYMQDYIQFDTLSNGDDLLYR